MTIHLIDLEYIAYYRDTGGNQTGLDQRLPYRCKADIRYGISSYGAGDYCELHTLGVF